MSTIYRKYRPQSWAEISGQHHVKTALSFEIISGRIAHAYMFSGPRGIGKTTIARLLAKAVNCEKRSKDSAEPCEKCAACQAIGDNQALDLIEIDAASHRGIDSVRDNIVENARFSPARLKFKVFIIDEVHMLTTEAFNALLKTLEEPPAQVIFILATTELHKVPATIVSRCQRFDFKRIPFGEMVERLHRLAESEGYKVEKRVLEEVARGADGCLRDAESLLGKVLTAADGKKVDWEAASVVLPRSDYDGVVAFVEALLRRDAAAGLERVRLAVEEGCDLDQFAGDAIETLRRMMVLKVGGGLETVMADLDERRRNDLDRLVGLADLPDIVRATELLIEKRQEMKSVQPRQLPLELAVARFSANMTNVAPVAPAPVRPVMPAPSPTPFRPPVKLATAASKPIAPVKKSEPVVENVAPVSDVEAVAPAEAAAVCAMSVDAVRTLWPQFVSEVGEKNPSLQFMLGACEPVSVEGNTLKVGTAFSFHSQKLNSVKVREALETVWQKLAGLKLRLEGVTIEKKSALCQNEPAMMAQPVPAMVGEVAPVPTDEVSALAEAFGGKVVN